jgi:murein DD-endopeptidase MepM/ murein hydrolase activator NlpD
MRTKRFCISSLSSIRARTKQTPETSPNKTRSIVTRAFIAVAIIALLIFSPFTSPAAYAAGKSKTAQRSATTPFLTLPFVPTGGMSILSGWYYSGGGGFHGGIDYINGGVNNVGGWRTFPVIASADGDACGNCTTRQGNAVWIKHNVKGATYYTYYGHLASIAKGIPLGSQSKLVSVKRGQVIGMAGDTGATGLLHLHYALYNAASQPIDPYSIGKLREAYPSPADGSPGIGWFAKW